MQDLYVWQTDSTLHASAVDLIDVYTSLLWVNRFYTAGEFELVLPVNKKYVKYADGNYLLSIGKDFSNAMFIEKLQVTEDSENGANMILSGRDFLSLLDRRVISGKATFVNTSPEAIMRQLIQQNIGENAGEYRGLPNFTTTALTQTHEDITTEFSGVSILAATSDLCNQYGIGQKIKATPEGALTYYILHSADKGVVFAKNLDNLISSNYSKDRSAFCNVAYVDNQSGYFNQISPTPEPQGYQRYEKIINVDISKDNFDTPGDFYAALYREGHKTLKNSIIDYFECEILSTMTYEYKKHYDVGDIIAIDTDFTKAKARIVEVAESWNENGYNAVPTLENVEVS